MILAGVFIIVVIAAFLILSNQPGKYDSFARCLDEKGAKMYGAYWCTHCKDQKEMFGNSWKYAPYVECSSEDGQSMLQVCTDAGIKGYPTWKFADGTNKSGLLSFDELSQKTGCPLPE
jgi:hypothetical protein